MCSFERLEDRRLFAIDTIQTTPWALDFNGNPAEAVNSTILDRDGEATGFTRVQANRLNTEYNASLIDLDTASGVLKLTTTGNSTSGGNYNADNTLVNGLETQFDATTSGWQVNLRLRGPLTNITTMSQQVGIMFGPNQDNYVKLVAIAQTTSSAGQFLQFIDEQSNNGTIQHVLAPSNPLQALTTINGGTFNGITSLDLRLIGDASNGKITAWYAINGGGFTKLSQELTLTGNKRSEFFSATARTGLIAMAKNNQPPITVQVDRFEILGGTRITRPQVTAVRPGTGTVNVPRDTFIAADVFLPNNGGGIDAASLGPASVKLYRTSDRGVVNGVINTSGGGDAIVFTPSVILDPNTNYTFEITETLQDQTGAAFLPFTSNFTTNAAGPTTDPSIAFEKVTLNTAQGNSYTGLEVGPDGKLYASTLTGEIQRFNINADGTLGSPTTITTVTQANGGMRFVVGITFGPESTAQNPVLYVSHGAFAFYNAPEWSGKISKLSGPNLSVYQDLVTNLPRSYRDHLNNQLKFGPDGAVYWTQGANAAMGAPDNAWGNRPERLLSAATLRLDLNLLGGATLDAKTEDGGTYNPFAVGAPLTIYGSGVRNAYDLVFHTNGNLYIPTNGSAANGNTPAGPGVPALTPNTETESDWLFKIVPPVNGVAKYYGHPAPIRNQFVLNGGNPTAGVDFAEVSQYPVGIQPDPNWVPAAYEFGKNFSPDGVIEYKNNAFGGALLGKLLVVRYSGGDDIMTIDVSGPGGAVTSVETGIAGFTHFEDPVDLTENVANGSIYVAELGGQKITLLRPITPGANATVSDNSLYFNDISSASTGGSGPGPTQTITIANTGTQSLAFPADGLSIIGTNSNQFTLTQSPTIPLTIAPGESVTVGVAMSASSSGLKVAQLQIKTNDPDQPILLVDLRGIGTTGTGGSKEPSLQAIMNLFQLGLNSGDANTNTTNLDLPAGKTFNDLLGDEVGGMQRLVRVQPTAVTIEPLAAFGVAGNLFTNKFGYYAPGTAEARTELFTIGNTESQSVDLHPTGATSFDLGNGVAFSLYAQFSNFTNSDGTLRTVYSEDALNTWDTNANSQHKVRFYQYKNPDGSIVPDAYVFAFEEYNVANSYDQQDLVGIIRNVQAAPVGPELGLTNLNGTPSQPYPDRLAFNRIQQNPIDGGTGLPTYGVRDTQAFAITNTGTQALVITSIDIAGAFQLVSPPAFPLTIAPGASQTITVKFTATGGDLNVGTLTINSNDTDEAAKVIELAGFWQSQSENFQEPTLQEIFNTLGYTTKATYPGQNINEGGLIRAVGDEVLSQFWRRVDTSRAMHVRQIAAYHTNGNTAAIAYYNTSTGNINNILRHAGIDGQSLYPRKDVSLVAGSNNVSPSTQSFGFVIDGEYSDNSRNSDPGHPNDPLYGHHLRFYVAKDRAGAVIPGTYLLTMDYSGINYDYQDNVYVISNIAPLTPPATPYALVSSSGSTGIALSWAANTEANLAGYNVLRSSSAAGPFTLLNTGGLLTSPLFNDAFAPVGTTSYYQVIAVDTSGNQSVPATTNAVRSNDTAAPATPTALTVTGTVSGITLDWANNAEVDLNGYNVYRSSSLNGTYTQLNASPIAISSYNDVNAPVGQVSYYRVTAVDTSANESGFVSGNANRPANGDTTPPAVPAALTATPSESGILLDWANNVEGDLAGYNVYRSQTNQAGSFIKLNSNLLSTSLYNDTAAPSGVISYYRVSAVDLSTNESGFATVSATRPTSTDTVPPAAPLGLVAQSITQTGLVLDWSNNVESDLAGYNVYRSLTGQAGTYVKLNATLLSPSTYSDSGLTSSTQYFYQVTAVDTSTNESSAASINPTTLPAAPSAPVSVTATAVTGTSINVTWADLSNEASYSLERKIGNGAFAVIAPLIAANTTIYADNGLTVGTVYTYRLTATNAGGTSGVSAEATALTPQTPFLGSYFGVDQNIQAEDFDSDGAGVSFNDTTAGNAGGAYRTTGTGNLPDIRVTGDVAGGVYNIGNIRGGEWLEFTVNVPANGSYNIDFRVASGFTTGKFHLEANGVDKTGLISVPNTGWNTYTTLTKSNVSLTAGLQIIRVAFDGPTSSDSMNFNWFRINSTAALIGTPTGLGATVSASGISLDWANNPEASLAGYNVYRSTSVNGIFTKLNNTLLATSDFLDSTASAGTTFFYRVTAVDTSTNESNFAAVSATTLPAAPAAVSAVGVSTSQIDLAWSAVTGATGYAIERDQNGQGNFVEIATVGANVTTLSDSTGLLAGTQYNYRVRANSISGYGAYSTVAITLTKPAAPSNVTATTGFSDTQINLTWSDVSGEVGFRIERSTLPNSGFVEVGQVGANVTSFSDTTGLAANTIYYYQVRAISPSGAVGFGPYSAIVQGSTGQTAVPVVPTLTGASATNGTQISVTWSDTPNETSYALERKTGVNGTLAIIAPSIAANTTSYNDSGLTVGTQYFYRLSSTNAQGTSAPSNEVTAVTPQTPFLGSYFNVNQTIQAEDFDSDGPGISFNDTSAGNTGNAYRTAGAGNLVDISTTTDAGAGFVVGFVRGTEYLEYTVNVSNAGFYDFAFRVSSGIRSGTFHVEVNGIDKTGAIQVPQSGWQTYVTLNRTGIQLDAGIQIIRLAIDGSSTSDQMNINWFRINTSNQSLTPTGLGSFQSQDINNPVTPGNATTVTSGSAWDVSAAGTDIFSTSDQFRFLHQQRTGTSWTISARVNALDPVDPFTKAGLMVRESLAANSKNVFAAVTPSGYRSTSRSTTGGSTASVAGAAVSFPNAWVRMTRSGDTYTTFSSTDGSTWTQIGQVTVSLGNTVYVGFGVVSKNVTTLATAQFRDAVLT